MNTKNNFKKVLSLVLVMVMALSTLLIMPLTASAEDVGYTGTGAEDDPYVVWTGAGMKNLTHALTSAAVSTYYIELGADIDMSDVTGYKGCTVYQVIIMDGKNHTISNFTCSGLVNRSGLFAMVGSNSSFKNIHFVGAKITSRAEGTASNDCIGILVGLAGFGLQVENCSVDKTSTVTGYGNHTAGLVGSVQVNAKNRATTFKNCVVAATVTADRDSGTAGGFISSYESSAQNLEFENCVFAGSVSLTYESSSNHIRAGGFAGYVKGVLRGFELKFKNCYNTGSVHVYQTNTVKYNFGGGLLGWMQAETNTSKANYCDATYPAYLVAENCFNTGAISVNEASGSTPRGLFGNYGNAEIFKSYTNLYTLTNIGPYINDDFTAGKDNITVNNIGVAATVDTPITLTTGETTIAKEMKKIDIMMAAETMDISTASGNLQGKLKLEDPFGFMAITKLATRNTKTYTSGAIAPADFADLATVGFAFSTTATTADAIMAEEGSKIVAGTYADDETKFCAAYENLRASELETVVYFVVYVTVNGETYTSEVRSIKPVEWVAQGATGTFDGVNAISEAEKNVYVAMLNYSDAYKAYAKNLED